MLAVLAFLVLVEARAAEAAKATVPDPAFDFGKVVRGAIVEHAYTLRNDGAAILELYRVSMRAPLIATRLPREVRPGTEAVLRFRLDTSSLEGPFQARILLSLNDPALPEAPLTSEGEVVPGVEVSPMPVVFLAAQRGEHTEASVDLINHDLEPLRILDVEHSSRRLRANLETVTEGRRYRLTLTLNAEGPSRKLSEGILVRTSSKTNPTLTIMASTLVRERVYTFPDAVDVGSIRRGIIQADPGLLERVAQTLTVYQSGGSDFQASPSTDVPALDLKAERGVAGDRWQITIGLNKDKVQPGPIRGTIFIKTNDPEFPNLAVPVFGSIL